jgi:hypothetical protein
LSDAEYYCPINPPGHHLDNNTAHQHAPLPPPPVLDSPRPCLPPPPPSWGYVCSGAQPLAASGLGAD